MTQSLPAGLVIVEEVSSAKIQRLPAKPQPQPRDHSQPSVTFEEEEVISARMPTVIETSETIHQPEVEQPVRVLKRGQYVDWTKLKDDLHPGSKVPAPLWTLFRSIHGIHKAHPDNHEVKEKYLAIKRELFERYLPDTLKQVGSYFSRKMPKVSLVHESDLQEAAKAALWKQIDKYDPNFGTIRFMQFFNANSKSRLLGAIFDALRALQEYPRDIAKQRRELKPMFLKLAQKLKHKPSPEEFLDEYGWDAIGSSGKTYREIITDPLFSSGVFNQRQVASSLSDGMEEEELESLSNYEARPAKNVHRLQSNENKAYIMSLLSDHDMRDIIDYYHWQNDTNERICQYFNAFWKGKRKFSLAWIVAKHKEALAILKERLPREKLEAMIPGWGE